MPTEKKFDNLSSLSAELALSVAESLRLGLKVRAKASLVVSGGRTPIPFLAALSRMGLDWSRVGVTLADERWVDTKHTDSNEALVRSSLLQNQAAHANFVGLKSRAVTPAEGEAACEQALTTIPRPFDVVVLGMGDDGHTASLFPQAPQLAVALDMHSGKQCIGIDPMTAPHQRMSLTLPALLDSQRIVVLISGMDKWNIYQKAMATGPIEAMPIRSILRQTRVPVDVYWSP